MNESVLCKWNDGKSQWKYVNESVDGMRNMYYGNELKDGGDSWSNTVVYTDISLPVVLCDDNERYPCTRDDENESIHDI